MDDESNNRKKRYQKGQGWEFTFIGETPPKQNEGVNQTEFTSKLVNDQLKRKQVFPLSNTQVGDRVVVGQILSGKSMVHQLSKQGLTLGAEVRVISKTASGSIVVSIREGQIGLGMGMANKVMVMTTETNL